MHDGGAAGAIPAVVDVPVIVQWTMGLATVKVPQIQFSPESVDIPVRNKDGYAFSVGMAAMTVFGLFFKAIFLRSVHLDVERQVSPR